MSKPLIDIHFPASDSGKGTGTNTTSTDQPQPSPTTTGKKKTKIWKREEDETPQEKIDQKKLKNVRERTYQNLPTRKGRDYVGLSMQGPKRTVEQIKTLYNEMKLGLSAALGRNDQLTDFWVQEGNKWEDVSKSASGKATLVEIISSYMTGLPEEPPNLEWNSINDYYHHMTKDKGAEFRDFLNFPGGFENGERVIDKEQVEGVEKKKRWLSIARNVSKTDVQINRYDPEQAKFWYMQFNEAFVMAVLTDMIPSKTDYITIARATYSRIRMNKTKKLDDNLVCYVSGYIDIFANTEANKDMPFMTPLGESPIYMGIRYSNKPTYLTPAQMEKIQLFKVETD